MSRMLAAVFAASLLVAGPACGGDRGEKGDVGAGQATTDVASTEAVKRPGTPFGMGFEVVDGSLLLGRVFDRSINGRRLTTAVLAVPGDPIQVWNAYVDQARVLGLSPTGDDTFGPCLLSGLSPGDDTYFGPINQPVSPGTVADLECRAYASLPRSSLRGPSPAEGYISLSLLRTAPGSEPGRSHLVIETDEGPAPPPPEGGPAEQLAPWTEPFEAPPLVDLPSVGEPFAVSPERYVLEEGSALIGSPAQAPCATGGFKAVFSISGDVRSVLEGYREQFDYFGLNEGALTNQDVAGEEVIAGSLGAAGGGYVEVVAMTARNGGSAHLLLSRCND